MLHFYSLAIFKFISLFYSNLNLVTEALSVTPLFIYDNIEYNKVQIRKDNKSKSGIYRWINTVTGGSYLGSSTIINTIIQYYLDTNYVNHTSISLLYTQLY